MPPLPRDLIYGELGRVGQALSSPRRLHLMNLLFQRAKTVEELAEESGQSVAATSAHLKVLREARLVSATKEGRHVRCRIADPSVARLWVAMREVGESRLPGLRELLADYDGDPDSFVALDGQTLLRRVRRGELMLVDVRPRSEYAAGHIPGARSIPFEELEETIAKLPRNTPIVAFCRGPYCAIVRQAVGLMRQGGLDAVRLRSGMAEWIADDLPVEALEDDG